MFNQPPNRSPIGIILTLFGLFIVSSSTSGQVQQSDAVVQDLQQTHIGDTLIPDLQQTINKASSLLNIDPEAAYLLAHKTQLLAEAAYNKEELYEIYEVQYKAAKQMGKDSLAYANLVASISARTEALTERKKILQEALNEKFGIKQQENEIALLKHDRQLRELKLANNKHISIIALPSFLILLLLSFILWQQYRRKKSLQLVLKENHSKTTLLNTELTAINNELIRSEQELKHLNQMKNNFFSVVSQDLKSPLTSLLLYLNNFIESNLEKDDGHNFVERINTSVTSLSSLLNNLLEWSRWQMGSMQYHAEILDIGELLKSNIALVQPQTVHRGIILKQKLQKDLKARVDNQMLGFVFRKTLNLYIEAVEENGTIVVSTKRVIKEQELLRITIKSRHLLNTHNGLLDTWEINNQYLGKTESTRGNLLGLMLCKDFVEKQGGTTHVSDSKKSIVFTFPLA